MSKKVAILQSNYIPWKGYFDLINLVDEFILYDEMQYTKRDWRNRNKIKSSNGLIWLTIPVEVKGKYCQKISEARIADKTWNSKHWNCIEHCYHKTKYFKNYKLFFKELYLNCNSEYLSEINYYFIKSINNLLDIKTKISSSVDYNLIEGKTERLVDLCRQVDAKEYITGYAAKDYIQEDQFVKNNIKLTWMDYTGYKVYRQLFPPFEHNVSIIDLIFNEGENATKFLKSFNQ